MRNISLRANIEYVLSRKHHKIPINLVLMTTYRLNLISRKQYPTNIRLIYEFNTKA